MNTFIAIAWPPSFVFADSIRSEIEKKFAIASQQAYSFSEKSFKKFMFGIYEPDKTPASRIKKKYKVMHRFGTSIVVFLISIDKPTMLDHKKTRLIGKKYCKELKNLKSDIRTKFASRVDGYVYDVVLHVGDNDEHTRHIQKLLERYGKMA